LDVIGATTDDAFTTICCVADNGVVTDALAVLDPVVDVPVAVVPVLPLLKPALLVPVPLVPVPVVVLPLAAVVPVPLVLVPVVVLPLAVVPVPLVLVPVVVLPLAVVPVPLVPVLAETAAAETAVVAGGAEFEVPLARVLVAELLGVVAATSAADAAAVPPTDWLAPEQPDTTKANNSEPVIGVYLRKELVAARAGGGNFGLKKCFIKH
jgi:hypothetical protein